MYGRTGWCADGSFCSDEIQVQAIEMRHKEECKGLLVQIRYLKAKFTRESTLRGELAHQKRYLLVLLGKFEKRCVS